MEGEDRKARRNRKEGNGKRERKREVKRNKLKNWEGGEGNPS